MRTSQEIQDEITALERRIQEEFIQRCNLAQMMTPRQAALHARLFREWYDANKAEGRTP